MCFNTQPREGDCGLAPCVCSFRRCFNTQPHGGGCYNIVTYHLCAIAVSTLSRAKAAANHVWLWSGDIRSFNTQPRGGGCLMPILKVWPFCGFNTQPRGGGCGRTYQCFFLPKRVSTHSRAEAAAKHATSDGRLRSVSTLSRAEAAACIVMLSI